jgi:hypothetical protein
MSWKYRSAFVGVALIAIVALAVLVSPMQVGALWDDYLIERASSRSHSHRQRALSSIESDGAEDWCGTYAYSNGFDHVVVELGVDAFYYEASSCGQISALAYGNVGIHDVARLQLEIAEFRKASPAVGSQVGRKAFDLQEEVYIIPWATERFLVPQALMRQFCELAGAQGWLAMRYAAYPRKVSPGQTAWAWTLPPLNGLPTVPNEFARYLPN